MLLHDRWIALAGSSPESLRLGEDLIARWSEPHRRYHNLQHLTRVLDGVDEFADSADDADAVRYAAWFHDAVYHSAGSHAQSNEELSALLAESELGSLGIEPARITEVARLVRLTDGHAATDDDHNGAVLCDADLAILGGDPDEYAGYTRSIRSECETFPDEHFRPGRAAVLRNLLSLPHLFRTHLARERYSERARTNLAREIAALEAQ